MGMSRKACVVGSGPNGLAAAIVLAQAGLRVEVLEAEPTPGGGVRTMELTLPGFLHDFGSAVHPLGAGSPFFSSLPLQDHGLDWIHSPAPLAHPLDDGTAVILERNLEDARISLGQDGTAWSRLVQPFVENWREFAPDVLRPISGIPKHPWLMARFGMRALLSAKTIAHRFHSERTRALFAGLAAHSFLGLDEPLSGAFGLILAISVHAVGWPIPRGGAQSLTNALCRYLATFDSKVTTSSRVESLAALSENDLILCRRHPATTSRHRRPTLLRGLPASPERVSLWLRRIQSGLRVERAHPWKASECLRAATVHLGGNFEEIAASEKATRNGQHAERPFVLLAQPTIFDPSRAPAGKHTAWAYCHVPNGSKVDTLERLEGQIERFAPGFRECVVARRVFSPAELESLDANLVGGDIAGGVMDLHQFLFSADLAALCHLS